MSTLCVPISGPSFEEIETQVFAACLEADVLEFRFDLFQDISFEKLAYLRSKLNLPLLFTLRKGTFQDETSLEKFLLLKPNLVDLAHDTCPQFIEMVKDKFPDIILIISYHDYKSTPSDLFAILRKMQVFRANLYKIACMAESSLDALKMVDFANHHPDVIALSMGECGVVTRLMSKWNFAPLLAHQKTAPGQLTIDELRLTLSLPKTLYGLIGSPVNKSPSHVTHNQVMLEWGLEGLYAKMRVEKEELRDFLILAKKIGMRGLSVTMPLKEEVMAYCDKIDPQAEAIGAVNTLVFQDGLILGYNTDGQGALDALEAHEKVKGKKVVIVGAGGSAKALIFEAISRGAEVTVLSRSKEKLEKLKEKYNVKGFILEDLEKGFHSYDILINTTSVELPLDPKWIFPKTIVMDIKTFPKETLILKEAAQKDCRLVFGYEMFVHQAALQFNLWFGLDPKKVRERLFFYIRSFL